MMGFFSQQAMDNGCSVVVYLNEKGTEVRVTAVYENEQRMKELYLSHWDDVVSVGKLTQFLRKER